MIVLDVLARFDPESIARLGFPGHDTEIMDLGPRTSERFREAMSQAIAELGQRREVEKSREVLQDLAILEKAALDFSRGVELSDRYELPYHPLRKKIFGGIQSLLDDSIPPERRRAALVRIRRYAGLEAGFEPIVDLAIARTKEKLELPGRVGPVRAEVEKDLEDAPAYVEGVRALVSKYGDASWQEPLAKLEAELDRYESFVKDQVLPRSRTDFRQPPEIYRFLLERNGVDLTPEEIATRARAAFTATQQELQVVATEVAKTRGWPAGDYRETIRALKKEQIAGDQVLPLYQKRIGDLEAIIREKRLVTLPNRPMEIRIATAAETAEQPAPHIDQRGIFSSDRKVRLAFVLPLVSSDASGALRYDDFIFEAASWTMTAHEARPGHDLQLSIIAERGLSLARTLFAFNSTNVEGWGLYAEAISRPFMPPDGQVICLQFLLLREARAFLDPELQTGKITLDEARRVLEDDVVLSEAMTKQELERYTFAGPGQAPTYFHGYQRMLELRAEMERALGDRFELQRFNDTVLAQGLLPPDLLRAAVKDALLGSER
jgi:hypothetical protein